MIHSTSIKKYIWISISVISLVLLWTGLSYKLDSPLILPKPGEVLKSAGILFQQKKFYASLFASALRCVESFLISICIAFFLAYLSAKNKNIKYFLQPFFSVIKSVPVIALILISLFWLRSSRIPILSAVLLSLPVLYSGFYEGFLQIDENEKNVFKCYGLNKKQQFYFIELKAAENFIKEAVHSSSGLIWKVVAASEVLCLPSLAVGTFLQRSQAILESAQLWAVTIIIILFSSLFVFMADLLCSGFYKLINKLSVKYILKRKINSNKNDFTLNFPVSVKIDYLTVKRNRIVLKDFCMDLSGGEKLALMGKNGAGKTTLLNAITSCLPQRCITSGEIKFTQNISGALNSCKPKISYVTQRPFFLNQLTLVQNIMLVLTNEMNSVYAKNRAEKCLEECGLLDKKDDFPFTLSGGELQRLSIARAFAFPGNLLLMDEAFAGVDEETQESLAVLMDKLLEEENRTLIFVTHSKILAERICKNNILKLEKLN